MIFFFSTLQFICCHKPTVLRDKIHKTGSQVKRVNQRTRAYVWYLSRLQVAHMWAEPGTILCSSAESEAPLGDTAVWTTISGLGFANRQ